MSVWAQCNRSEGINLATSIRISLGNSSVAMEIKFGELQHHDARHHSILHLSFYPPFTTFALGINIVLNICRQGVCVSVCACVCACVCVCVCVCVCMCVYVCPNAA
ncbi:hypothetical protein K492DRAFT_45792 [Lichtheimia hyalospora FSU 10163]|nr:hypothetical protein K492DRAFT_45792 [Lichtheimia hyalospora FSU 10163]